MDRARSVPVLTAPGLSPLLGGCSPQLLEEILSSPLCEWPVYRAGEVVYDPLHFRRCLGVLLEGELEVTKGSLTVSSLEPGAIFGAAALYSDRAEFATTITAKKDSRCLLLPQTLVDSLIARDPGFRDRYLRYLTGRILFLSSRLQSLSQPSAEGRLARYLLANLTGEGRVTCPATQLAKRLGLSRATLYRAFEVLEESGLILRDKKTITIPDPSALEGVL